MAEPLDLNKSALTHRITALAVAYLDGAGFKPIETEVTVSAGWVADVASFVYPTRTELKKLKLDARFREPDSDPRQHYDGFDYFFQRYGFLLTAIVEIKVSRSDFMRDIERKFKKHPAHVCYVAYPQGMLDIKDLRDFWGWGRIECSKNGTRIMKIASRPQVYAQHPGDTIDLIAAVAIRRDHRTRYAAQRALMRSYRAEDRKHG